MNRAAISALALVALAGVAMADVVSPEDLQFGGSVVTDIYGNTQTGTNRGGTVIYSNTASAANAGTSSLDLNTRWGDSLHMTGSGVLDEFSLTVFNSSSSGNTGSILTYEVEVLFYRLADTSFVGGFSGTINFGAGLNPGFYSVVTFTGLSGLGIDLDTADVLATQKRLSHTGTSFRMGVASLVPVTIGSSDLSFYKDDPSSPPAGFYTFSSGAPADLGYQVVIPTPGALALLGFGGAFAARRRR